jgi:hypothetical protein
MKRMLFILTSLVFLLSIAVNSLASDLSVISVQYLGPDYHFKDATDPTATIRIGIKLENPERPADQVSVQIDLYELGTGNHILTKSVDFDIITLNNPGDILENLVEIPLYDGTHTNYELNEGEYIYEVILQINDENTGNNAAQSPVFGYRIFSGDLYFGDVLTSLTPTTSGVEVDSITCATDPYRIIAGSGTWFHSWGSNALSYFDLCAFGAVNPNDNYSVDLRVTSGSVSVGNLSATVANLGVSLSSVVLDPTGMNFSSAIVNLPDDVSVHQRPAGNQRINSLGASRLTFSGGGPVGDPEHIVLSDSTDYYFHSYGLPFYIYAQAGISFNLGPGSAGIIIDEPDT